MKFDARVVIAAVAAGAMMEAMDLPRMRLSVVKGTAATVTYAMMNY